MAQLHVRLLPALIPLDGLNGATAVAIDVLRATTTIVTALANEAREVIPCQEIEEARVAAASRPAGSTVLGGERGGLKIPGFDCGNSPAEYTAAAVGGKAVIFTTT